MRLARAKMLGQLPIMLARAGELLAKAGNADADQSEDQGLDDLGTIETVAEGNAEHEPERRGEQAGPQPASAGGEQHRGDEDEKGRMIMQPVLEAEADQEHHTGGGERDPIGAGPRPGREYRPLQALQQPAPGLITHCCYHDDLNVISA